MSKPTWEKFRRYHNYGNPDPDDFWGCVDKDGEWFDSGATAMLATHWIAYSHGEFELSPTEELSFVGMTTDSIIHGSLLKKMYEAGLLK